jgi:hypothetical protein
VLGHHHVSQHYPLVALPYLFQHLDEQVAVPRACQEGLPAVTTKSEEVQVASAMPAFQAHGMQTRYKERLPRAVMESTLSQ